MIEVASKSIDAASKLCNEVASEDLTLHCIKYFLTLVSRAFTITNQYGVRKKKPFPKLTAIQHISKSDQSDFPKL